ncbi:hypothetical protein L7F22_006842 [Adiantum nelumboides]|nr:hypothetical protein [Adiantum nelumboides]
MRKSEAAKSSVDKHDADEGKSSNLTTSASNRHFAIYDVKGAKPHIRNIFDACERGDHRTIMSFAKDKDFDVDAKDRFGRTALIWAADCGHLHICESLIRLNANINTTDLHTGRCAIHWAARTGSLPIVRLLVQYGANINKEDKYGLTPLYLAKSRGPDGEEVFQYLLAEGAPYNELKTFHISAIEDQIRAEMAALEAATAAEASKSL